MTAVALCSDENYPDTVMYDAGYVAAYNFSGRVLASSVLAAWGAFAICC